MTRRARPPHPQFALSVGIVGHRPDRMAANKLDKIARDVGVVLDAIASAARHVHHEHRALFAEGEPVLTLVSALAEGADTIAAKEALKRGYQLDVPLPFPIDAYKLDFHHQPQHRDDPAEVMKAERQTQQALEDFDALLERARSVLVLPGKRRRKEDTSEDAKIAENRAYESAGLTVLSQSDIILAVWDDGPSHGRGGTSELIAEAARAGLPIIVVDAKGEKPPVLRWRNLLKEPAPVVAIEDLPPVGINAGLTQTIDELIRLPAAPEQQDAFWKWFKERHRTFNWRIGFPLLMMIASRVPPRTDFFPRSHHVLGAAFEAYAAPLQPSAVTKNKNVSAHGLAVAFGWADAVAIWCAQFFRGAFVVNFLFSALAVLTAAAGVFFLSGAADHAFWTPIVIAGFELFLISYVVWSTLLGQRRRWHRRWFEAREMAERLRVALPLWALGLRPGSFAGEEVTWTGWYVRAVVRAEGMRSGDFAEEQFQAARDVLVEVLRRQREYNIGNERRMHRLERRLERFGGAMLGATIFIGLVHLCFEIFGAHAYPDRMMVWLSVALPALATASYGVRMIGDLEGIARRSERTHKKLDQIIKAIEQDSDDITLLRARAHAAADILLGDVSSWRLSAESRGLAIPG